MLNLSKSLLLPSVSLCNAPKKLPPKKQIQRNLRTSHHHLTLHLCPPHHILTLAMPHKKRYASRLVHQKHSKRRGKLVQLPPSPFFCAVCSYHAIDAYDLSSHLRGNFYCTKNNTLIESTIISAHPTIPAAASLPPDNGDSFLSDYSVAMDETADDDNLSSGNVSDPKSVVRGGGYYFSSDSSDDSFLLGNSSAHSSSSSLSDALVLHSDSDDDSHIDDHPGYEFYEETSFPSGVDDVVHVGLVDLCHTIKAPQYAYNLILCWAQDAQSLGYSFPVEAPLSRTFIKDLKKRLNVDDYNHKTATVEASGGGTVSFPVFDFQTMFLSLIDDPRIKPGLLVNWDDPPTPPPFDPRCLDEIHSGDWHLETSQLMVESGSNDILCGIILAIDRTHVADKDKLSLEPVLFSLSIIPRALRNLPFSWRPLGFIPKLPNSKAIGNNARTYHKVLASILSGLVLAQKNGGIKCGVMDKVDAHGVDREFCFKVPLAFVIGDVEGHDVLCGRYSNHSCSMLS
jgi:hypothetical protein